MKIVIAPQAFKESLSALQATRSIEKGVKSAAPHAETVLVPVADGGDGTLETLVEAMEGRIETARVVGPVGERVEAEWAALGDGRTAVIEMARAAGLALAPPYRRNPLTTTTYGVGELMAHAVKAGFRKLIIGVGGSATNDAGAGMAQALGVRLLDRGGKDLLFGGGALADLDRIDVSRMLPKIRECDVEVACDVSNPLTGPEGASAVYGPQKGATPDVVERLDAALGRFSEVAKRDLGVDVSGVRGAGAAGGLGAGLLAFLNARLRPGADIVLEVVRLAEKLQGADLVITGEGRLDYQTVYNKAPVAVARLAMEKGVPVVALCGALGEGHQRARHHGISAAFAITKSPMSLAEARRCADVLLSELAEEVMRLFISQDSRGRTG